MRTIKIFFIISYVFWGGLGVYALSELLLRNVWFELFPFEEVAPLDVEYEKLNHETTLIKYQFEPNGSVINGERRVADTLMKERLPNEHTEMQISYNKVFPCINHIDALGLKSRNGYVALVMSAFFICLTLLFDVYADKGKWANKYKKALK